MSTLQRPDELKTHDLELPLYGVTARLRLFRIIRFSSLGALVGVLCSLITIILNQFDLLPDWSSIYAIVPIFLLVSTIAGVAVGTLQRISVSGAAALVEGRLGLKERISSALEFAHRNSDSLDDAEAIILLRLQREDALFHARMVRPSDAVPYTMTWETRALIPALVILLLALFVPDLISYFSPQARVQHAIVGQTGLKLIRSADDLEKEADAHRLTETRRMAESMRRLGQQMRKGHLDKRAAMIKMATLSKQIETARNAVGESGGSNDPDSLQKAGKQLAAELNGSSATQSGPGAGTVGGNPGSGAVSSTSVPTKELADASSSMQQNDAAGLGDQLRRLADRLDSRPMAAGEESKIASDLDKLARSLQGTALQEARSHVQAAATSLRNNDKTESANELRKAADAVDKAMQQAQQARDDSNGLNDAGSAVQNSQDAMAKAQNASQIDTSSGVPHPGQNGGKSQPGPSHQGRESGQSGQTGKGGQGQSGQSSQVSQGHSGQGIPNPFGQPSSGQSGQSGQGQSGQSGQGQSGQSGQGQSGQSGEAGQGKSGQSGNGGSGSSSVGSRGANQQSGGDSRSQGHGQTGHSPGSRPVSHLWGDGLVHKGYGRLFIPAGNLKGFNGGSEASPRNERAGLNPGQQQSRVPYEPYVDSARRTAESSMDREDIAPAYRTLVREYYDSLATNHK